MFVFRGWGGHLSPHLISDPLGLSGTCADSIEVDARGVCGARVDAARGLTGGLGRKWKIQARYGTTLVTLSMCVAMVWVKCAVGGLEVVLRETGWKLGRIPVGYH